MKASTEQFYLKWLTTFALAAAVVVVVANCSTPAPAADVKLTPDEAASCAAQGGCALISRTALEQLLQAARESCGTRL